MIEKRIICDCDGPLLGFIKSLIHYLKLELPNEEIPSYKNFYNFNLKEVLNDKQYKKATSIMKSPTFWMSLEPVEKSIESIDKLRLCGYDIIIATAPWRSCDKWENVRRRLIDKYFNIKQEDVIICSSSRKYIISGYAFIDDKYSSVRKWKLNNTTGIPILFPTPWNEMENVHISIDRLDWDGIIKKLL